MNTREIEKLLEKYYDGETSLEEEKMLRAFFTGKEIPAYLQEHAPLFNWVSEEIQAETSPDFEILLPEEQKQGKVVSLFRHTPVMTWVSRIAAGLAIIAGLTFTLYQVKNNRMKEAETKIAYEQTRQALLLLSANLNTGLEQAQKLQAFQKGVQKAQRFSAFYKYQSIIINPDEQNVQNNK